MRGLELLPRNGSWKRARVGVLGLGRSGRGALRLLERHGADAQAFEDRIEPSTLDALHDAGLRDVQPRPGREDAAGNVRDLDVLVVSPGIAGDHPMIAAAEIAGVLVISELELAWRRNRGEVVAVTGTNGKSTTVSLVHALLAGAGRETVLAGNIGVALSDEVEKVPDDGVLVVECSSFQLERILEFHPRVAAVLNLAPDHMDRYAGFEDYAAAKRNILRNQEPGDLYVHPAGDRRLEDWARSSVARALPFAADPLAEGVWVDGGRFWRSTPGGPEALAEVGSLRLLGRHNLLNVAAAVACVTPWELPAEVIAPVLGSFEALPHRAVRVPTSDGRTWIDDSKATNVHAASATLAGLEGPVVLLAGGSGKDEDYAPLREYVDRIRCVICFGAEGPRLYETLHGAVECERVGRMADALERARSVAHRGDTVLLSPACASFDEFSGFAERGDVFTRWVRQHEGGSA